MSATKRRWHVFAVQWLSHDAYVDADTREEAIAKADTLWAVGCGFEECDSDLESLTAYEE